MSAEHALLGPILPKTSFLTRRMASLLPLVIVLAACSDSPAQSESPSTSSSTTTSGQPTSTPHQTLVPRPTFRLEDPAALVPEAGIHLEFIREAARAAHVNAFPFTDESFAFHQEVFADGEVERSEYDRAVHAAAGCMRGMGYTIEGPFPYGPNTGVGFSIGSDPRNRLFYWAVNAPPSFDRDSTLCQEIWEFNITTVWIAATRATEADRQIWLEAAWDCGRQRGMTMSSPPNNEDAITAVSLGCEPWLALPPGSLPARRRLGT